MKKLIVLPLILLYTLALSQGGPPTLTQTLSDGNWSDATIWDNGVPANNKSGVINHNITLDNNGITKDITINGTLTNNGFLLECINFVNNGTYTDNSGTVEIRQNGAISGNDTYFWDLSIRGGSLSNNSFIKNLLVVQSGVFNTGGGNLTLLNDATYDGRVGNCTGSISGTFIWQKYLNRGCLGWTSYGFPATATLSDINLYYTFNWWSNTYWYDETVSGVYDLGWVGYTNTSQTVSQGLGILHYSGSFSKTIQLVSGLPNTFTFNVNYSPVSADPLVDDGWNLVGNPFPGTIDWDNPNWTKTNVSNAIYTWNTCSELYGSYVGGMGTGDMDNLIPSGESFWVQTIGTTPSLVAPKSVIVNGSAPMMKNGFSPTNTLRVKLNGDDIIVNVFRGTEYFDEGYDALKMGVGYLKTIDDDGIEYSINSLPNKQQTIPLWTRSSGVMSFEVYNIQNSWKLYLEDTYTNTVELITNNFTHLVSGNNNYEHRYNIIYTKKPIVKNTDSNIAYRLRYEDDRVIITSDNVLEVEVYDMLGRRIQKENGSYISVERKNLKIVNINGEIVKIF